MKVVKSQQWLNKTDRQGPYNASLSERHRKRISEWHKGKKVSEETKQRISKNHAPCFGSANGFFGHTHTKESKERIGNRDYSNQKGGNHYNAKPVRINGEAYQSIKDASIKLKISQSAISSYLKGRRNPPKGWVVEYLPKT